MPSFNHLRRPVATLTRRTTHRNFPNPRTFWKLQRTEPPPPATSALLVLQGLLIVLGADYAVATLISEDSVTSTALRSLNILKSPPAFTATHSTSQDGVCQVSEACKAD